MIQIPALMRRDSSLGRPSGIGRAALLRQHRGPGLPRFLTALSVVFGVHAIFIGSMGVLIEDQGFSLRGAGVRGFGLDGFGLGFRGSTPWVVVDSVMISLRTGAYDSCMLQPLGPFKGILSLEFLHANARETRQQLSSPRSAVNLSHPVDT